MSAPVCVIGEFDNVRAIDVRFLQEAARLGPLHVHLLGDAAAEQRNGVAPKFPLAERRYLLEALRFVTRVEDAMVSPTTGLPAIPRGAQWAFREEQRSVELRRLAGERGVDWVEIPASSLAGYPMPSGNGPPPREKRVIVTGCYDWFHSGHVRFFEEVATLGDLYVVVGHDANIRLLKGEGHPMFHDVERRYLAASVRHVREALISTGRGWLDAEPEIERIRPHIYAVNEDGDRPEKRKYCEANGIQYVVLKREPAHGLPKRSSTALRGF